MLAANRFEPVLSAERIDVPCRLSGTREPVGPLPSELGAEAGALVLEPVIERRNAQAARAVIFLVRKCDGVVLAIGLERARANHRVVVMNPPEAADIDRPEVHR